MERGFVRMGRDGEVELTLAHPLGLVEVAHGPLVESGFEVSTDSGSIGRTHTGLDVTGIARRYRRDGDTLGYELDMRTERTPMTLHLRARLRRVG
jgi:hypothetical protein